MAERSSIVPGGLPPLNALRAFEAVVRTGSAAAAAVELCVTPSAISHQLGLPQPFDGAVFSSRTTGVPVVAFSRRRLGEC